jgi:glycosyltransferase involved in cell wall biosynthesis
MKNPLVSIIVAVFNEEKYLNRCLQSLKNQSYKDIEIIIVDDGSTDKSRNIIKQYNVKYLSISHSGPGVARNKGAQAAKGEILVFVDADMYYDKEYIKELVKPIVKKNMLQIKIIFGQNVGALMQGYQYTDVFLKKVQNTKMFFALFKKNYF